MLLKQVLLCVFWACCSMKVNTQSLDTCGLTDSTKRTLCAASEYDEIPGVDMDATLNCILKTTKIVDETGAGNFYSLFDPMAVFEDETRRLNHNLEACMTRRLKYTLPEPQRAHAFYRCMMAGESQYSFKKVFNARVCN
ncbi:uncharacterized protein LOC128276136 [Anopheles cruzii]|uniref:uncharacterized protein LOC128276136 n=1 Tax=Anopheles cruzii TaxID=68878 RepID=UPI0022EC9652|nr:uncharacterized protein LOC128276136 [Anopheles cruzii]